MKWKLSSRFSVLSGDVASHTPVGGRLQRSKETPLSHSTAPSEAHARAVCDGRPDPSRPALFQLAKIPHATLVFSDAFIGGLRQDCWISQLRGCQFGSLFTCFLSQSPPCSRSHGDSEGPYCHPGQRYKILQAALLAQGLSGTDLAFMGTVVM